MGYKKVAVDKNNAIHTGMKRLTQVLLIPVFSGIIGMVLLTIVFLIPTGRMFNHVQASVNMLIHETDYYSLTPTLKGSTLDNYTEVLYLNEALINTANASLRECVLSGYKFTPIGYSGSAVQALSRVLEEPENSVLSDSSKRFFNGYEIVVKPLLVITDYSGIRQFNMLLSIFLSLCLIHIMIKRKLQQFVIPVVLSFLFIRPLTMSINMSFFGFYVCMIAPCIVELLLWKERLRLKAWLVFGVSGAVTFYFNVNYIQLLCFGVPILFYFLILGVPKRSVVMIKTVLYYFFTWMIGYVGMMVFKWVAYAFLIDADIFKEMITLFLYRTGVDRGSRIQAIIENGRTAFGNMWWNALEISFVLGGVIGGIVKKKKISFSGSYIAIFIIMLALPIGRYIILANHVIIHNFVTYRLFMIPVLALNLLITRIWSNYGLEESEGIYL